MLFYQELKLRHDQLLRRRPAQPALEGWARHFPVIIPTLPVDGRQWDMAPTPDDAVTTADPPPRFVPGLRDLRLAGLCMVVLRCSFRYQKNVFMADSGKS